MSYDILYILLWFLCVIRAKLKQLIRRRDRRVKAFYYVLSCNRNVVFNGVIFRGRSGGEYRG